MKGRRLLAVSTKGTERYDSVEDEKGDVFLFARRSRGLLAEILGAVAVRSISEFPWSRENGFSISPTPWRWVSTKPGGRPVFGRGRNGVCHLSGPCLSCFVRDRVRRPRLLSRAFTNWVCLIQTGDRSDARQRSSSIHFSHPLAGLVLARAFSEYRSKQEKWLLRGAPGRAWLQLPVEIE